MAGLGPRLLGCAGFGFCSLVSRRLRVEPLHDLTRLQKSSLARMSQLQSFYDALRLQVKLRVRVRLEFVIAFTAWKFAEGFLFELQVQSGP